jgi:branched-chain amino acid aminotransferase
MAQSLTLLNSTAFIRGSFVPFSQANVSIASSPVLYGLAVYTVFSASWNPEHKQLYIFRLKEHYERLVASCRIMDFQSFASMCSFEQFQNHMVDLLKRNKAEEDVLVRVMVFIDELAAGTRMRGLTTALAAYVSPLGEILQRAGVHVAVSSWQRVADNMIPVRAKINGSYVNTSLMKNEALMNGYDDAIALDTAGHVAEGTVANVFIVKNDTLVTPTVSSDLLEGITRDSVMTAAERLHIPVQQRDIDRSELYTAQEAMFVGSSARIVPILSIDRRPVGNGQSGAITERINTYYNELLFGMAEHNWLTTVY